MKKIFAKTEEFYNIKFSALKFLVKLKRVAILVYS